MSAGLYPPRVHTCMYIYIHRSSLTALHLHCTFLRLSIWTEYVQQSQQWQETDALTWRTWLKLLPISMGKHCSCFLNATNILTVLPSLLLPSLRRYYMCITHTCTLYYVWCLYLFCPESDIDEFLQHYRTTFPTATITPKLHMMEDHVVDFVGEWGVGIGMLGEQGAESIHTIFNQLARTYANITNGVERLKSMVTEHNRQICPQNRLQPAAKRKKTEE